MLFDYPNQKVIEVLHPFLVAFPHSKEKDDPDAGAVFAPIKRVFQNSDGSLCL